MEYIVWRAKGFNTKEKCIAVIKRKICKLSQQSGCLYRTKPNVIYNFKIPTNISMNILYILYVLYSMLRLTTIFRRM